MTLVNLQALCTQQKVASRGRAAVAMGLMRMAGYVAPAEHPRDRRVKLFEPTAKFVDIIESWTNRLLQIVDVVMPGDELARAHAADPALGRRLRRRGTEVMLTGWRLLDPFPEVGHFIHRDAGWMLLLPIIATSIEQGDGGLAPVSINLDQHAKRFGVSRSHYRHLLETSWQAGLLAEPPRNGSIILPTPALAASFVTCMASELSCVHAWALAAREDLRASRLIDA